MAVLPCTQQRTAAPTLRAGGSGVTRSLTHEDRCTQPPGQETPGLCTHSVQSSPVPLSRHPARTLCCLPRRVMALRRRLGDPENTVNAPTVTGRDPPLMSPVFSVSSGSRKIVRHSLFQFMENEVFAGALLYLGGGAAIFNSSWRVWERHLHDTGCQGTSPVRPGTMSCVLPEPWHRARHGVALLCDLMMLLCISEGRACVSSSAYYFGTSSPGAYKCVLFYVHKKLSVR